MAAARVGREGISGKTGLIVPYVELGKSVHRDGESRSQVSQKKNPSGCASRLMEYFTAGSVYPLDLSTLRSQLRAAAVTPKAPSKKGPAANAKKAAFFEQAQVDVSMREPSKVSLHFRLLSLGPTSALEPRGLYCGNCTESYKLPNQRPGRWRAQAEVGRPQLELEGLQPALATIPSRARGRTLRPGHQDRGGPAQKASLLQKSRRRSCLKGETG